LVTYGEYGQCMGNYFIGRDRRMIEVGANYKMLLINIVYSRRWEDKIKSIIFITDIIKAEIIHN